MKNAPLPNIEARFRAYAEKLSTTLGHADRVEPFQAYCTDLLLPVECKSVETMAAQLAPGPPNGIPSRMEHNPRLCRSLDHCGQKMVFGDLSPEFNPDKFPLL